MIKLGVFDLDGTLLTDDGNLPESFWKDLNTLADRQVQVAIASARPAQFLFEMFDRDTDLLISGEDGNIFFLGKRLLHARYVSQKLISLTQEIAAKYNDLAILYTGLNGMYVSPENYQLFLQWGMARFMPETPVSLSGQEKICKIHVLCKGGVDEAKEMISSAFQELQEIADVQESGYGWISITEKDSNKASAVKFFQNYLNVQDAETAVFGDSSNDIPMFELTPHSFAMKNASQYVKQKAAHITKHDNDHNGAMETLLEITAPGLSPSEAV